MKKQIISLLVAVFVVALLPTAAAAANDGTRHELCTALSPKAEAYYAEDYAFATLSQAAGVATANSQTAMGSPLYSDLRTVMTAPMTASVTYKNLINYWPITDAAADSDEELLFYSDVPASERSSKYINREHVWPKSHASFHERFGGADLHHLRPEDGPVNSTRNNLAFGDVISVLDTYKTKELAGKTVLWYDAAADRVEVKDDVKGDVARVLLYVYVRWGQPNLCTDVALTELPPFDADDSANDGLRVISDVDTLLKWCATDPVDTWEMRRNDLTEDIQGNRNIFIDYPEFAWLLFGRDVPATLTTPTRAATTPFVDVPADAYYAAAVAWAVANKVTTGTSPTTFTPKKDCNRGEMVTFLWRAAGSPSPTQVTTPFTDVAADAYYGAAVAWAVEKGITYGTSATAFSPAAPVSRGQVVAFLARYAQGRPTTDVCPFHDVAVGDYFRDAVLWAVENGVTAGTSTTTFSPRKNCNRGEIVTFLYRYAKIK